MKNVNFEDKITIFDYKHYSNEDWNDILYNHKIISKKEYENKIRKIKLEKINFKKL